jgi:hypothetical protein
VQVGERGPKRSDPPCRGRRELIGVQLADEVHPAAVENLVDQTLYDGLVLLGYGCALLPG